jgi:uncharacterized membrane protein YfhO
VFDRNWSATVDGRPAPVLLTDYLMQGVPVPAGTHTVDLTYRDRALGVGLLASGGAWLVFLGILVWLWFGHRRHAGDGPSGEELGR